ncbi:MAG: hypothetical protein CMN74_02385 [Sphingorhabdus sp.]|nr:hypothetical protein [Sphingorhabdus sp.]|tara:strand:- start:2185 stop:4206 length:2022 start_codon:yes stop_codon:yes gene_type:complete
MTNHFSEDNEFVREAPQASGRTSDGANTSVYHKEVERMLSELSDEQREAAKADAPNVLLLAPAGTGKTRVMTTRFVALADAGTPIERILMCTFTNAAAYELIERIEPAVAVKPEDLWVGTTHSIGLRIIRENAETLGFTNVDAIMDREQQEELIQRLMRSKNHPMADSPNEKATLRRILEFIEKAKNAMKSPEEAMDAINNGQADWAPGISREDAVIYAEYELWKRAYDMIDYNDMLYLPTMLIEGNKDIAETWRSMFDHVMVDEYQDLSRMQIRLLKNIVGSGPDRANFYAAADDDQAIYGWRGSDVRATIEFHRHWSEPEIIHIRDNYRTPKSIFGHASKLITHNSDRHAKSIRTAPDPDAMVKPIERQSEAEEKKAVMETIIAGCQRFDVPFERVAILCRSNRACQEYAAYLASNGMKVNLHESIRLGARPIRALVSWMQLATRADNPLMYEQIAAYPEPYLPEKALIDHSSRLQKRRNREPDLKIGPVALLLEMYEANKVTSGSKAMAEKILEVREFIAQQKTNPFAAVSSLLGITSKVASSTDTDDHQLPAFLRLADEMANQIGLEKTLASLTQLDLNAGREGINVATMHGAKGLEYDIVALPGWEEGEFPSYQRKTVQEISEERRLAYVALTRARKMLIVSWSGRDGRSRRPSRFLVEAGIIGDGTE